MKEFKMNRIGFYSTFALVCIMFISCGSHMQSISMPDGWHVLRQYGYVGVADKDGNIIIPSIYKEVLWHYGYFKVRLGDKYGMLNVHGAEVIPPIYENVWVNKINNNYFCVQKNGHYKTIRGNTSNSSQINESALMGMFSMIMSILSPSTVPAPNNMGNMNYLLDPNYAIMQTEQQNRAEYAQFCQQFKKPDGSNFTYEEFMAAKARAFVESQGVDIYEVRDDNNEYNGKLSPDQYEARYRDYERSAQGYYNALTTGGVRSQDDNGKIQGKTVGQISGGGYATWKQGLSKAQANMKRIREEAARYGVHIQQSQWETATAGY